MPDRDALILENTCLANQCHDNYNALSRAAALKVTPAGVSNPPPSPLRAHVGFWLRFVSNHVSQAFRERLAGTGVTVAEWVITRELFECHEGIAPSELAQRLQMSRGTVSRLVERIVTKGLATRVTGTGDRRFQVVALSARGRHLVPRLARLADENDDSYFSHMTADQRDTLISQLEEIVKLHALTRLPVD